MYIKRLIRPLLLSLMLGCLGWMTFHNQNIGFAESPILIDEEVLNDDPPPLGPKCIGYGPDELPILNTPEEFNEWCGCVWGSVYVDGVPLENVPVTIGLNDETFMMPTMPNIWDRPVVTIDGRYVDAKFGDEVTLSATVNGETISRTYRALPDPIEGIQQVDLVFPSAPDGVPTVVDTAVSFGYGTVTLTGSGQDDGEILGYEWRSQLDGVIGTQATAVIRLDALTQEQQIVEFRVQDDKGTWSEPKILSLPLHRPMLTDVSPELAATNFVVSDSLQFTASQPILPASVGPASLIVHKRGGVNSSSASQYTTNSKGIIFKPLAAPLPGEIVQWTVTPELLNSSGLGLVKPYVGQFAAGATAGGTGFFTPRPIENLNTRDIEIGDVDGDGDFDYAAMNGPGGSTFIYLNDGNANFTQGQEIPIGGKGVEFGDFNRDGWLDLVLAVDGDGLSFIYFNDGSGNFVDSGQLIANGNSFGVKAGDLDGDGDLDLFFANTVMSQTLIIPDEIFLNNGSGQFSKGVDLGMGNSLDVALGDIDLDGDLDAITANWDNEPNQVWLNNGDGTFTAGQGLGSRDSQDVAMGDLNGDGWPDLFFANQKGQTNSVWLNTGRGTFYDTQQILGIGDSEGVSLGDLEGDGDLDAFVVNERQTDGDTGGIAVSDRIWLNNGQGVFTAGQTLGDRDNGTGVSRMGDLDGDGDLDVIVANDDDDKTNADQPDHDVAWLNNNPIPIEASEWLIMLYMAADNDLDPFLRQALSRLEDGVNLEDARILVLFDGARPNDSRLVEIENGVSKEITVATGNWLKDEIDMGDGQVLSGFVNWAIEEYPAEKRYLTIANHGAGVRGVAWDWLNPRTQIGPAELQAFAADLETKIDIIHFDACSMAMVELADLFKDKVDYMVASQNLAWGIFIFEDYFNGILDRSPREQAIFIAEQYAADLEANNKPYTISALDLTHMDKLTDALANVTEFLVSGAYEADISVVLQAVQRFDSADYFTLDTQDEFIDLYDFVERLSKRIDSIPFDLNAEAIMKSLDPNEVNSVVIYNRKQSGAGGVYGDNSFWDLEKSHGLAIYFPSSNGTSYADYSAASYPFATESNWSQLLIKRFGESTLPPPEPGEVENAPTLIEYRIYLPMAQN